MRVWIINPFDELPGEPGRPGRYWSLCQVLADQGHEVTWWTADFSHRRKVRRAAPAESSQVERAKVAGRVLAPGREEGAEEAHSRLGGDFGPSDFDPSTPFRVRLVPVTPYRSNVGLARIRSHRAFGRNLERLARAEVAAGRRPDRIVASWPPVEGGEVAVRLGREWGVPVTIDFMDAWPEAFSAFIPGPPWVARLLLTPWRRRARQVFRAVERVSGVGRSFLDYARSLGATGPMHLAYLGAWFGPQGTPGSHGSDGAPAPSDRAGSAGLPPGIARFHGRDAHATSDPMGGTPMPPQADEVARSRAGVDLGPSGLRPSTSKSPLRLLYLGNIGRSQDLDTVLRGLALARRRGLDVELEIAGGGERWAELERVIAEEALGGAVRLHGFLSGAELEAVVARAQVGVNPVRGESLIACPYKVADYLAAGLPVLNSLPGELADLLAEYGAGRSFVAGQAETFAEALAAWVREPESLAVMSAGARRLGEAWFAREKTYPELARFVVGG